MLLVGSGGANMGVLCPALLDRKLQPVRLQPEPKPPPADPSLTPPTKASIFEVDRQRIYSIRHYITIVSWSKCIAESLHLHLAVLLPRGLPLLLRSTR